MPKITQPGGDWAGASAQDVILPGGALSCTQRQGRKPGRKRRKRVEVEQGRVDVQCQSGRSSGHHGVGPVSSFCVCAGGARRAGEVRREWRCGKKGQILAVFLTFL